MVAIGGSAPMMLGVMWTFQAIAFCLVALRVYARLNVVQTYGWDDHLFNGAVVILLVYNILCTVSSSYGLGQPLSDPPSADQSFAQLLVNVAQCVITLDAVVVKTSIAVFLLRLVAPVGGSRRHAAALLAPAALLGAILTASTTALWFACTPVSYSWTLGVPGGHCNGEEEFILGIVGGLSIVLAELFYASYPWYLIWRLQIPRREKFMIGICMSFGYFSAICSICRILALLSLAYASDANTLVTSVNLMIWHEADIITQLVCIGVSVCRPLYKDWLNEFVSKIGSTLGTSNSNSNGNGRCRGTGSRSNGFSVIALKTIGGSSVVPRGGGGGKPGGPGSVKDAPGGGGGDGRGGGGGGSGHSRHTTEGSINNNDSVVNVERSWRVESKRDRRESVVSSGDAASEEYILGDAGFSGFPTDANQAGGNERQLRQG